jgi:hypothetical protein
MYSRWLCNGHVSRSNVPSSLQVVALWKRKVASGQLTEEATSFAVTSCSLALQTHFESIMRTAEVRRVPRFDTLPVDCICISHDLKYLTLFSRAVTHSLLVPLAAPAVLA